MQIYNCIQAVALATRYKVPGRILVNGGRIRALGIRVSDRTVCPVSNLPTLNAHMSVMVSQIVLKFCTLYAHVIT
jgi:hypothetical protein